LLRFSHFPKRANERGRLETAIALKRRKIKWKSESKRGAANREKIKERKTEHKQQRKKKNKGSYLSSMYFKGRAKKARTW
jgi:hypothetical protein